MKKWMTMIELIAVISVLAIIMSIGSIRLVRSQENKWAKQEITTLYNTFSTHNRNISRWKAWSRERTFTWNGHTTNEIIITQSNGSWRTITWDKISFSYCSGSITLWKNISHSWDCIWADVPHFSTLYICEKWEDCGASSNKLLAEIQFHEITNNISLIWTWKFTQND
jgi:hypothetical protein